MRLFDIDSQYREKAVIWRILSVLPLYAGLSDGHMFKWFAINIPMELVPGTSGTSDIDVIACLSDFPRSRDLLYYSWEVKVALIHADGTAKSLKTGKVKGLVKQLNAYQKFGAPRSSALDVFLFDSGFSSEVFPPAEVREAIIHKAGSLTGSGFGYDLMTLGFGESDNEEDGFLLSHTINRQTMRSDANLLEASNGPIGQDFSVLVSMIDETVRAGEYRAFSQVVYCRKCNALRRIDARTEHHCPKCQDDLISQG